MHAGLSVTQTGSISLHYTVHHLWTHTYTYTHMHIYIHSNAEKEEAAHTQCAEKAFTSSLCMAEESEDAPYCSPSILVVLMLPQASLTGDVSLQAPAADPDIFCFSSLVSLLLGSVPPPPSVYSLCGCLQVVLLSVCSVRHPPVVVYKVWVSECVSMLLHPETPVHMLAPPIPDVMSCDAPTLSKQLCRQICCDACTVDFTWCAL